MASLFSFLYQLLFSVALPLIAFLLYEHLARRNAAVKHDASDAATAAFASQVQEELTQLQKQKETTPATTVNTAAATATVTAEAVTASPSASAASAAPAAVAAPKPKEKEEDAPQSTSCPAPASDKPLPAAILIAYASQSQNSLALAHKLFSLLSAHVHTTFNSNNSDGSSSSSSAICPEVRVLEMREEEDEANNSAEAAAPNRVKVSNVCRVDTLLDANQYALTIFITSTYTDGMAPPRSQAFEAILKDAFEDHRIPRNTLAKKRFAVFGLGDIAYGEERFNTFAKHLHEWCRGLGAPAFVVPPVYATENKTQSLFKVFSTALLKWVSRATFHADGTLTVKKKTDVAAGAGRSGAASTASSSSVTARVRRLKNTSAATPAAAAAAAAEGCACCQSEGGDGGGGSAGPCCRDTQGEGVAFQEQDNYEDDDEEGSSNGGQDAGEEDMDDVEDLVWDGTDDANFDATADPSELPELLYPKLRQNLEKQGYRLIGSHSGVKLCRWTKSMLRGRGGCYKHTFYNINSSQCMEMTPSLACANKCVFCWRHHTNPISRHFRWKQDPPELLIAQGMAGHYQMIKQMRGVPGVTPERLATAMQIRHCALSLVGEPIMYPQINGFCDLLHENHISSFMVTNAQFPEQLRDLKPVVQLYLSIDAPTPDELKRIDRPLFEDYWERCVSCVKELAKKPQRTVFRLTLVNMYNTENVKAYADLVDMGQPDFIEVKGVTYCGTSTSSTLTMKDNVPRHDEVIGFCKALCEEMALRNPQYKTPQMYDDVKGRSAAAKKEMKNPADDFMMNDSGDDKEAGEEEAAAATDDSDVIVVPPEERDRPYHIACEHEHSCCVLIALDKFFYEGHWHTWIDYEKFYELVESGRSDFTSLDYAAPTPTWATYKSKERGFDPEQTRVTGKKARPTASVSVGA